MVSGESSVRPSLDYDVMRGVRKRTALNYLRWLPSAQIDTLAAQLPRLFSASLQARSDWLIASASVGRKAACAPK